MEDAEELQLVHSVVESIAGRRDRDPSLLCTYTADKAYPYP